jgi:hypothetical protein
MFVKTNAHRLGTGFEVGVLQVLIGWFRAAGKYREDPSQKTE